MSIMSSVSVAVSMTHDDDENEKVQGRHGRLADFGWWGRSGSPSHNYILLCCHYVRMFAAVQRHVRNAHVQRKPSQVSRVVVSGKLKQDLPKLPTSKQNLQH